MTITTFEYNIEHKTKGTRTFYYPTKNGKRFNQINYARKYDAVSLVKKALEVYGEDTLEEMFA